MTPCKGCIVYAVCQYKNIWRLIQICPTFRLYLQTHIEAYAHPWTRTLREFQTKGES